MNELVLAGVALAGPFLLSLLLTRLLIAVAPRVGLIDRPALRKFHVQPTPLGGGLAIYLSVIVSIGVVVLTAWMVESMPQLGDWLPEAWRKHVGGVLLRTPLLSLVVAAASIQMLLGLVDDWRPGGLDYRFRLGVEVILVAILIYNGVSITLFTAAHWLTTPITILWIVGLTNAVNFLDNMDGLAAGVSIIACLFFATVMGMLGSLFVACGFFVLVGALAGFLVFNFRRGPARIFMGDAGSNFLGFWMGTLTVVGTFQTPDFDPMTLCAPLCILAVPIYDSSTVIALRLRQGKSPFLPDKQHFSHRLVDLGLTSKQAVLLIYLMCFAVGLAGVLLYFVERQAVWLVVVQVFCMLGIIALLEAAARRRRPA